MRKKMKEKGQKFMKAGDVDAIFGISDLERELARAYAKVQPLHYDDLVIETHMGFRSKVRPVRDPLTGKIDILATFQKVKGRF